MVYGSDILRFSESLSTFLDQWAAGGVGFLSLLVLQEEYSTPGPLHCSLAGARGLSQSVEFLAILGENGIVVGREGHNYILSGVSVCRVGTTSARWEDYTEQNTPQD